MINLCYPLLIFHRKLILLGTSTSLNSIFTDALNRWVSSIHELNLNWNRLSNSRKRSNIFFLLWLSCHASSHEDICVGLRSQLHVFEPYNKVVIVQQLIKVIFNIHFFPGTFPYGLGAGGPEVINFYLDHQNRVSRNSSESE